MNSDHSKRACECGHENYCPAHRYRWEYEQDDAHSHSVLDEFGAPRAADPPNDVILSVAGRIRALLDPAFLSELSADADRPA